MSMMKIVVCETEEQVALARERMRLRGFRILHPGDKFEDVIWDASQAKPSDAPLAFDGHFVVIGTK